MAKKQGWQRGQGKFSEPTKLTEGPQLDEEKPGHGVTNISQRTFADNEPGSHIVRGPSK